MTPESMVAALRARGVTVWVAGDALQVEPLSALTPAERTFVLEHPVAVAEALAPKPEPAAAPEQPAPAPPTPLEVLDSLLAADDADNEAEAVKTVEAGQARYKAEKERYRLDRLACLEEPRVRELIAAGRMDERAVRDWHAARQELEHRQRIHLLGVMVSGLTGQTVRIIE